MAKFNTRASSGLLTTNSPIRSEFLPSGATHEGAPGYRRTPQAELFLMAVSSFADEKTFYEKTNERNARQAFLVEQLAVHDIEWLIRFVKWLRTEGNMRSSCIQIAAHGAYTRHVHGLHGYSRQLINASMMRADEPGEMLAYYTNTYGRRIPKPVKRGIADAALRLYNQRSLLKYDTNSKGFRFGDVIELTHPKGKGNKSTLFTHAIDRRHNRNKPIPDNLEMIYNRNSLSNVPLPTRRQFLKPHILNASGITWESLAGWLQGPMDREAWEAIIPTMGYMALLRNLRNFDQAGVSDEMAKLVAEKLADPNEVKNSKQFPMRFLSAYRSVPTLRWGHAIEQALEHSLQNITNLNGRTLILVDTSGSMNSSFSKDGTLMRWDAAVIFGVAIARTCESASVISFSAPGGYSYMHRNYGTHLKNGSMPFPYIQGESLLKSIDRWQKDGFFIGCGTDTQRALADHYVNHDRVIILTDEQAYYHGNMSVGTGIPAHVPMYTWNLAGYQHGHAPSGYPNRHTFGGLNDACFNMIPLLESSGEASWPF